MGRWDHSPPVGEQDTDKPEGALYVHGEDVIALACVLSASVGFIGLGVAMRELEAQRCNSRTSPHWNECTNPVPQVD
jgi:hypothetical protein